MPIDKDFKRLVRDRMAATGERYTEALAAFDRHDDGAARLAAVEALRDQPLTVETFTLLTERLGDERADVRSAAVSVLLHHHVPNDKAFKRLVKQRMAETGESYVHARAALDVRLRAVDALLAQLGDPDWRVRKAACQLLDDVDFTPETFAALTACLDDESAEVRRAAVHTLTCAHCKPDGCVLDVRGVFEKAKHDRSARVREMVIGPLTWGVRESWAVELLGWFAANETNERLRREAEQGVAWHGRQRDADERRRALPAELRAKTERHPGKWVAIADDVILAAEKTPNSAARAARGMGHPDAALYFVAAG